MAKETALKIVVRTVDEATAELNRINKRILKIGAGIEKIGKKLTTHVTLPVVALGAASLKSFADFETGMSDVSTLIDTNTESLDAMGRKVLEIGGDVPRTMEDLTAALYDVRSAGVSAANQFDVLRNSAELATAGKGETKEAVDLVTSSLNAFGLEGEKAAGVYDTIFKAVKFGKTDISQLAQGFGGAASTIAGTGTELDEYLATVAALTTTGAPASQVHTQLVAVISGLTRKTKETSKVFKTLGAKDLRDLIAKSGGLVPALQKIEKSLGGNQSKMLKLVGSTQALNAIMGITGAQNATFVQALDDMRNGANAVDIAFAKQNKTMAARWQRTKNVLLATGVVIGETLAPAMETIANMLQSTAKWFAGLDKSTQNWIISIAAVAAVIGPLVVGIGKMVSVYGKLAKAYAIIAAAQKAQKLAFLGNPIVLAIAAIAVAALLIYKYWTPIKAFFSRLWSFIKKVYQKYFSWLTDIFLAFTPLGRIIKHWEPIKEFFSELWDSVVGIFEYAWDLISDIVDKVAEAAKTVDKFDIGGSAGKITSGLTTLVGGGSAKVEERRAREARAVEAVAAGTAPSLTEFASIVQAAKANIQVEFVNTPRGTRVTQTAENAEIDTSMGYQMVTP